MKIVDIKSSTKKHKRYCVLMDNGEKYDFGLDKGQTYIDNHDTNKRANYWKRHTSNEAENKLITNLVPSPALFSAYILWGKYDNIGKNINYLNKLLRSN